ncbi:hypothetical protein SAMN05428945_0202 [Streptomyces sp. 2224.1]|uniref:hypothetical protein n=1 Tax=unclassified Streptomyces TaxID=2593676 RepID=UPI0008808028|nr:MULTISPECIES: hypothetical protein [unclassified Streptomyces]PBC85228.1 hypothetical protein BX261_5229 [Streptomyces sp. 2321.6]SDR19682.1 hypothetical protein SAMN05216511_2032 [Streptomyces sp. KS_16]SEB51718.1 hypothetical protein SAMN05428945_0202 [Streptomyces sp. 2224.1]SED60442.1 hypothetical protein SAMN05428940_5255 [Streptomyces sp. 2133.1]SEE23411.1 hypothetical protein SAMN05428954_2109 [Streptomyces sp. 2112.3]
MYHSELELRIRQEELRRAAGRRRLVREATEAAESAEAPQHGPRGSARSGTDEPGGRVRTRGRWLRLRRAAV